MQRYSIDGGKIMKKLENLKPERVFKYFEEITKIPRDSGNMEKISIYCMDFAKEKSLKAIRDDANNVIIYKPASRGYEACEPVILQGHLDMVCQKDTDREIDFEKDGLDIYVDGDYIKARGTTLGADNGIAVAMMLAILESEDIAHPPIEAVFTTDEEIGMVGARKLDMSLLKGKRMINLDTEEIDTFTVSCAGGSDFRLTVPTKRKKVSGRKIEITISGLLGGHSGVEIHKGRINANILAGRILDFAKKVTDFDIIAIDGGDKGNAIPLACKIQMVSKNADVLSQELEKYFEVIKAEALDSEEKDLNITIKLGEDGEYEGIDSEIGEKLIYILLLAPNGVQKMSAKIENLVETSLNLGILKTDADKITILFALRSNKKTALEFLEEKLKTFVRIIEGNIETSGHYPPWEFNQNSTLQNLYKKVFFEKLGYEPALTAIHAGLECGVFSSQIEGFDAIAIGPLMHDIHTTKERLSISSTEKVFEVVVELLKNCK